MTPADFLTWRERLGWTQAEAAAALGKSRRTIVRLELGSRDIAPAIALACAELERRQRKPRSSDRH